MYKILSQKYDITFKFQLTEENNDTFTKAFHLWYKVHRLRFALCSNKGRVDHFFQLLALREKKSTCLNQMPFNSKSTA